MSILSTLADALRGAADTNATAAPGRAGIPGLGTLAATGSTAVILSQVMSMIQSRPGGLAGILQSIQQGGLEHLVESWIGTGQNLPLSADQLRNTLGSDWISRASQATGLPQSEAEQHLSNLLPQIVDHLSPDGRMPQGDLQSELATLAQRLLPH